MVTRSKSQRLSLDSNECPRVAMDDLVPSGSCVAPYEPGRIESHPHRIESEVRRLLLEHPDVCFASLVVHRMEDGVCLEGVIEVADGSPDVEQIALQVPGVKRVINHLLVHFADRVEQTN